MSNLAKILCAATATAAILFVAPPARAVTFDFDTRQGFTAGGDGAWSFQPTVWFAGDVGPDTVSTLDSPLLTVSDPATLSISLEHLYTGMPLGSGAAVQASVNGSAYNLLVPDGGYSAFGCTASLFACWKNGPANFVTDTLSVPGVTAGDSLGLRFVVATDAVTDLDFADYQILNLEVTSATLAEIADPAPAPVPLPATAPMLALALGGLGLGLRRRGQASA